MKRFSSRFVAALAFSGALVLGTAGCGLQVTVTGPTSAHVGQVVPFDVTVTNASQCPVGNVEALFVPFLGPADLVVTGDPVLADIILGLIDASCTGQPVTLPGGITCEIVDNSLVCTAPTQTTPGAVGDAILKNEQGTVMSCHLENGTMSCQIPALAGGSLPPPPPSLMCSPIFGSAQVCTLSLLGPGQSAVTQISAVAPQSSGLFRTLVFAGATRTGNCIGGPDGGQPCDVDGDCSMSTCGSGVCVNPMTQAISHGCNSGTDCPMTESCVQCEGTGPPIVPLGCAQITVIQLAPATSLTTTAAAAVILLALGFFGLIGLRRRN